MIASTPLPFARSVASLAMTLAFSATLVAGQPSVEPAAQVREAEAALARAMHTRTSADLERLLAPGYVLRGAPDIDRATWLRNALALCWGDRADIDNFSATPLNDVVIASLTLTFYVDPSSCRPAVLRSLVTDVWSRSADGWQLQVRHSGPPPVGSGVAAQYGAVPERPPIWDVKAELSMAGTRGNTTTSTIGSGATAIHTAATSSSQLEFRILRNRTDGVTRAQMLTGRGRHARNVGRRLQVFADSGYARDRFAGLEHQLTVTGGLSSRSTLGPRHRFSVDGGLGVTSERRLGGDDRQFATATSALHYTWVFRLGSEFTHATEVNADLQSGRNWRTNSETAVSMPMTRMLSLRFSNGLDFRHAPVPGFRRTDVRTALSLIVTLRRRS